MISEELLKILVCPETKQPVQLAQPALVEELNRRISSGELKNRSGGQVKERLDAALVRQDGRVAYPVRKDIPVMLVEESLLL